MSNRPKTLNCIPIAADLQDMGAGPKLSTKIAASFAALLAILAGLGLLVYRNIGVLDASVARISHEEERGKWAAYEMEIRAFDTGLIVLDYLETARGDAHPEGPARSFARALEHYRAGADSAHEERLADKIEDQYERYYALGLLLMEQRDQREGAFLRISENFEDLGADLGRILENVSDPAASKVTTLLVEIQAGLGNYLRLQRPEEMERIRRAANEIRPPLRRLVATSGSDERRDRLAAAGAEFEALMGDIFRLLRLRDAADARTREFFDLRQDINATLEREIQVETERDLDNALARATRAVDESNLRILAALAVAVVVAGLGYVAIRRSIVGPANEIMAGVKRVGEGDLSHRIEIPGSDEFGRLAAAFNEMVARRSAAEADSAAVRRRTDVILEHAADGIVWLDARGRARFANPAAADMLGYAYREVEGRDMHALIHHSHPDGTPYLEEDCPVSKTLRDGIPRATDHEVLWRKNGTSFHAHIVVSPVIEDDGVSGAVIVFRDVSQRREIEKLKEEFLSEVSHELRTPLTSIRAALGLLHEGAGGEMTARGSRMVDIALVSTDRLIRLVNDILDIERMDTGRIELSKRRTHLSALLQEAANLMETVAGERGIQIQVQAADVEVEVDTGRIVQTLTNLLSNAVKFSPEGGTVWMWAEEREREVVLRVKDEGRGIPKEKVTTVFDRFRQVEAGDAGLQGGTGLGLAICKAIVEQHGGHIWVDSVYGRGSIFSFSLLRTDAPELSLAPDHHEPRTTPPTAVGDE